MADWTDVLFPFLGNRMKSRTESHHQSSTDLTASLLNHARMPRYNHSNSIIVRNITGTSASRYRVSDLRGKYLRAGGRERDNCQVKGCAKRADGAFGATGHVQLADGRRGNTWYLVWICKGCNNRRGLQIPLRTNALLVPVRQVTNPARRTN